MGGRDPADEIKGRLIDLEGVRLEVLRRGVVGDVILVGRDGYVEVPIEPRLPLEVGMGNRFLEPF